MPHFVGISMLPFHQETAKSLAYYSSAAAWQYTSVSPKLSHALDENIDYTGRFTW